MVDHNLSPLVLSFLSLPSTCFCLQGRDRGEEKYFVVVQGGLKLTVWWLTNVCLNKYHESLLVL